MELLKGKDKIEYELPVGRIALSPSAPRDSCRLMVVKFPSFKIEHIYFRDIVRYFSKGDVIAVNDTKVIKARIIGEKKTGGRAEFLLVEEIEPGLWKAFGKPASRLKEGMEILIKKIKKKCSISILKKNTKGVFFIKTPFDINEYGYIPLPPYIISKRELTEKDEKDYQTVFAAREGSIASPTAALHFTDSLIECLKAKGVSFVPVTLHVGSGTFRVLDGIPEPEYFDVKPASTNTLNSAGRICICGTTVMRVLETVYTSGKYVESSGKTELFIKPGHIFGRPDMFITNFHQQGTPLLLMVAAYIEQFFPGQGSRRLVELYNKAIEKEYMFFSYGDAMLLINERH